jgi:hypothetical protein
MTGKWLAAGINGSHAWASLMLVHLSAIADWRSHARVRRLSLENRTLIDLPSGFSGIASATGRSEGPGDPLSVRFPKKPREQPPQGSAFPDYGFCLESGILDMLPTRSTLRLPLQVSGFQKRIETSILWSQPLWSGFQKPLHAISIRFPKVPFGYFTLRSDFQNVKVRIPKG